MVEVQHEQLPEQQARLAAAALGLLPDLEIGGVAIGERAKRRKEAAYQRGETEKDIKLQQRLQGEYLVVRLHLSVYQQRRHKLLLNSHC